MALSWVFSYFFILHCCGCVLKIIFTICASHVTCCIAGHSPYSYVSMHPSMCALLTPHNSTVCYQTCSCWCLWCVYAVQVPPWQAEPSVTAEYQQLVDNGAYPAAVAAAIAAGGKVSLLNCADVDTATLERLLPGEWWNDELVNYGMWLLQRRDAALHDKLGLVPGVLHGLWDGMQAVSCHFFNSFFMNKLYFDNPNREVAYAAVRNWTSPSRLVAAGQAKHAEGVLSCSLLVAPCNLDQQHWVLVVADLDRRRILYLDPGGVSGIWPLWVEMPQPYLCMSWSFVHYAPSSCIG